MVVNIAAPPLLTDYPAIFRGYIVRNTQDILARVQQAGAILPPAEREQALHTLSYALKLPEAWPDTRTLLLTMAPKMEQAGYRDEWMPYLAQGIQQSQYLDDIEAEAALHLQLGMLYQLRGKYKEAHLHLVTSAEEFERLNARRNQVRALNRLAYVARLQRQFEEATRLVETVRRLLDKKDYGTFRQVLYVYSSMTVLFQVGLPKATSYFLPKLPLSEGKSTLMHIVILLSLSGISFSILASSERTSLAL